ncbi:MAG: hypothetical protein WAS49_10330 [Candidatus Dechloromonas phosphoritropha]|jgi:hypothetical protein
MLRRSKFTDRPGEEVAIAGLVIAASRQYEIRYVAYRGQVIAVLLWLSTLQSHCCQA